MSSEKPLYLQALDALRRRETLFRILIFSLVTVLFWIGFSIFFSQTKTKVSIDILKYTEPLNPNISREVLQDAALRTHYSEADLQNFPLYDRVTNERTGSQLIIAGTEEDEAPDSSVSAQLEEVEIEVDPEVTSATGSATPTLSLPEEASASSSVE